MNNFMKKYQGEKAGKIWRESTPCLLSLKEENDLKAAIDLLGDLEKEVKRFVLEI